MKNEFEVRIEFADLKFYNKNCTTENRYGHQVIYDKMMSKKIRKIAKNKQWTKYREKMLS